MILRPDQKVANLRIITEAQQEQTIITPIADNGAREIQKIVCPATAGATQADYFVIENQAGTSFAVWIDIDAAGVQPTGAAYVAADVKITGSIATGDTAPQVAAKLKAIMDLDVNFVDAVITIDVATLIITQDLMGNVIAPARHNAGDLGNGSFVVSTFLEGNASNLQNKYFLIRSPTTTYSPWFNVNGEGVNPAGGGTALAVALVAGDSLALVASKLNTVLDNHAAFVSVVDAITSVISCTNAVIGEALNATVGTSGFTIYTGVQGAAMIYSAGMSPAALTNTPSLIAALS